MGQTNSPLTTAGMHAGWLLELLLLPARPRTAPPYLHVRLASGHAHRVLDHVHVVDCAERAEQLLQVILAHFRVQVQDLHAQGRATKGRSMVVSPARLPRMCLGR